MSNLGAKAAASQMQSNFEWLQQTARPSPQLLRRSPRQQRRATDVFGYSPSTERIVSRIENRDVHPVSEAQRAPSTMQRN